MQKAERAMTPGGGEYKHSDVEDKALNCQNMEREVSLMFVISEV